MRTKHFIQQVAVALVVLMAGTVPAWSTEYDDPGGGKYDYSGYVDSYYDNDEAKYFKTIKSFDVFSGDCYWEFEFMATPWKNMIGAPSLNGEVLLVTNDNVRHKVGQWDKAKYQWVNPTCTITDSSWGYVSILEPIPRDISARASCGSASLPPNVSSPRG